MAIDEPINQRALAIGHEIFELAGAAGSKVWQQSWWLDRLTRVFEQDEQLKARMFAFVDCLPSLRSHAAITRHLAEYLDSPDLSVPKVFHAALGPGPLRRLREETVGRLVRFGAHQMAGRYIAAYDKRSALRTLERLRSQGMAFTLDVLGESTTSRQRADEYAQVYHELLNVLTPVAKRWPTIRAIDCDADGPMPRVNLSIKLTGLDPHFDPIDPARSTEAVCARLRPLLRHARDAGAFVNIDMEAFAYRDVTLHLFKSLFMEDEFRDFTDVGIVLQAYLKDAERDLAELLAWGRQRGHRFSIRLVKGAYWDAETAAAVRTYQAPAVWINKWESDACYERMTRILLEQGALVRPAFASHNVRSLAVVLATARSLGIAPNNYEIQTLYGMGDVLKTAMVAMGQCVRVYCPFGDLVPGMGYLIRRLLENTSNEGFLKQGFSDRGTHDRLLADPARLRPPSEPLARRFYRNTDPEEEMSTFTNAANTNFANEQNRRKMLGAIEYVRGEKDKIYPLVVAGEPVTTAEVFESPNPSQPSQRVGRVAMASAADVDRAVAAAMKAFRTWRATTAVERADLLRKLADRLDMHRFELAATMILEVGKPWREADADVTEAVDHCRYYADQIERIESRPRLRNIPSEDNKLTYLPKGVCGIISPWAFPLAILTGMTSAALAAGNTVVIKPARKASMVAAKLVEMLHAVGFPPGVVNFVPGVGSIIGPHLVEHGDVSLVAFTGSHEVGSTVIRAGAVTRPGQSFIKKMIVEMGGKNAIIVDDDADLDGAVQAVITSAFAFAGQKCSSCSRLIVLDGVFDSLMARLHHATESILIGPAEVPTTVVGPVIDQTAQERIQDYIALGHTEGRLLIQAPLPPECADGFFVPPTVFVDVQPDARIAQEEIFGPVLAVLRADDFDHALTIANGTRYALTGGLFSRSPAHIEEACREFAVGNLYINRRITGSQVDAQPFGGFRLSGTGVKAGSPDYLLHFMDARCITENTQRSGLVPKQQPTEVR